jgi:hypothetical protein
MVSKNDYNNKAVLATLALMLLSLSVASSIAISTPHYASAQGVTGGAGNATNATTTGAGNATNATNATTTGAGNATNATNATTTGDAGTTAGNQTVGGPLAYMVVEAANR